MKIKALFVDIGGVFLTNGWDRKSREQGAHHFKIDHSEMESRHRLTFELYEIGKMSLDDYLNMTVFYQKRPFTKKQFKDFMYAQSQPYLPMIELVTSLKQKNNLKVVAVSNEGRELNDYRIKKFKLRNFIDFFISSCFVHLRKPDEDIYRIALDAAQVPLNEVLYIEDRLFFVQVAEKLGIKGFQHLDYQSTAKKLPSFFPNCGQSGLSGQSGLGGR